MDRITKRDFKFTREYVASHLQSWSIAQALTRLQEYENTLEDLGMTMNELYAQVSAQLSVQVSDRKHPLHEASAKIGFIAKRGKQVKVGDQYVTEYGCPHCGYEWLEYSDMPEYPYHCPGCGESLWADEEVEEDDAILASSLSISESDDADTVFTKVKSQLDKAVIQTAFGDVQAMCDLPNNRVLEFTLEKEMLPPEKHHYSVQLHCSEKEYDAGCFEQTVGVIRTFLSDGIRDEDLLELVKTVLLCDKYTPIKC